MSSLLNKLTGHSDKHTDTTTHGTHGATTTTQTTTQTTGTTGTNMSASNVPGSGLHGTSAHTSTTGNTMAGTHTSGSTLGSDNAMTRSEEQLRVNKSTISAGKAELNKYVTTEHVSTAVPVSQEKVVVEREPINSANVDKALKGPAISEAHYETTLKKDVVTAEKDTVPIERIRLAKQTETGIENVGADLRKEHVELSTNTPDKVDLGAGRTVGDKIGSTGTTGTTHSTHTATR